MTDAPAIPDDHESIDFYWSFRSHYCYLALDRTLALEQDFRVTIKLRPVYPIAIRNPEFFSQQPKDPKRWQYIVRDAERIAESLGMKFSWPDPDPVQMNMQTLEIAAEQPYIYRLTGLAMAADSQGHGLAFTTEVARLIWSGTKGWDRGDHLSTAVSHAGLDIKALESDRIANQSHYDESVKDNERALHEAGHWGVPTIVFRGEPFFGQDRIDLCRWRMEQQGL